MFRRRPPAPSGDALVHQAFGDIQGLAAATATLRAQWPDASVDVARDALSVADLRTGRSSVDVLRKQRPAAVGSAPALAAWVVLAGPVAADDYDGYGLREGLHALHELRREARGRRAAPPDPQVGAALDVVLAVLRGPFEQAVCAGVSRWHLRARRGCVAFLEEAESVPQALAALASLAQATDDEPDDDLRYTRAEAVRTHQRLATRHAARARQVDPTVQVDAAPPDNVAVRRLLALADDDPDEGVRIRALESLARLEPHVGMLDVALRVASDPSPPVRRAGVALLERLAKA